MVMVRTVSLGRDGRAGRAFERLGEGGSGRDQRLAADPRKVDSGFELRSHRAFGELGQELFGLADRELADLFLVRLAPVPVDAWDFGQDHEPVRAETLREEGRGAVFVDHSVDAPEV